jgi:hypothetical protein
MSHGDRVWKVTRCMSGAQQDMSHASSRLVDRRVERTQRRLKSSPSVLLEVVFEELNLM